MDTIDKVNSLRQVAHSDFANRVRKVAVILTSPRSGSSLLKSVLASHPDIASLDGEMEPFLSLTRNGFASNTDSDALKHLSNIAALQDNIFDEMTLPCEAASELSYLKSRWVKRLLLQFPMLFSEENTYHRLLQDLDSVFDVIGNVGVEDESQLQDLILAKVFKDERWRLNYYDGKKSGIDSHCFNEAVKLEEPPFVLPRQRRRALRDEDVEYKTLLFKTPPDVYRMGLYEQLFPNATIKYLHLTRGYAQSVNGLMDGWLSPVAFFSRDVGQVGLTLNIKGYSDHVDFGKRWWKFDLPPNWREFTDASLEEVCLNQWQSAHKAIFAAKVQTLQVSFEEFLSCPVDVIHNITSYLGLPDMKTLPVFPVTMATEAPKQRRWKKRQSSLLCLGEKIEVRAMMKQLGYQMDPQTWL